MERLTIGFLGAALSMNLAGCSAEPGGASELENAGETQTALAAVGALRPVRSVLVMRKIFAAGRVGSTSRLGLDSQNALPSGVLSDTGLRRQLETLGAQRFPRSTDRGESWRALVRVLEHPHGYVLLKYLARCAFTEDQRIDPALVPDAPGRLGLAPSWQSSGLTVDGRRWITACLMAHTNNIDSVDIAISGSSPELANGVAEADRGGSYEFEEAAFYGDIFQSGAALFACSGTGVQQPGCGFVTAAETLRLRICGSVSAEACGFDYMGACNKYFLNAADACTQAMPYNSCRGSGGARWSQVLTTSLKTTDVRAFYPNCSPQ